jgi:CO/xanthine dehydrogenase FAD-binding subunit
MNNSNLMIWSQNWYFENYYQPQSVQEALDILDKYRGEAKIIAGGTDVLVQMRRRELAPRALVDVTKIPGLDDICLEGEIIRIGALATHSQISQSPLIQKRATALSEGASKLGSPQIRNLGTLTGNIVSGQPGADTAIPLLALDARVKVLAKKGETEIPLTEFFIHTGKTAVDSSQEIITEIFFPALSATETSICLRLAARRALALPILVVCIILSADLEKKRFQHARIALGPVAPTPFRAVEAERILTSAPIKEKVIRESAKRAALSSSPRDSLFRGCSDYRKAMVENMVERGIHRCLERLEASHGRSKGRIRS